MENPTTTPDSVPSLSALSSASTDPGDVARVLFQTPEHEQNKETLKLSRSADEKASLFGSDISVASSESDGTIVETYPTARASDFQPILMPTSSQNLVKENDQTSESIPVPATCHGALSMTPQDLAGMFNIFGIAPKPADDSPELLSPSSIAADSGVETDTDAVTEVTSNVDTSVISWDRRIDSLERECATLKDIIKSDSVRILQLRTELAWLRGKGPAVDSPTKKQVDALKREKDTLLQRESLHLETIKLLKKELEEMAEAKNESPAISKELEQLRLQNELLASQIVENETELRALETENSLLKEELANMRKQETVPIASSKDDSGSSRDELEAQVASLFAKISEIESDRERRDKALADESRQTHEELATIKTLILEPQPHIPEELHAERESDAAEQKAANDSDAVEVTLEGQIITTSSGSEEENSQPAFTSKKEQNPKPDASQECGAFCDCFPSASSAEDEE